MTSLQNAPPSNQLGDFKADPTEVARIKSTIRLSDRAALVGFGDNAQRDVGTYADTILRSILNKDTGDVGDLLSEMLLSVKGLDPTTLKDASFFERLFGGVRRRIEKFKNRFQSVAGQVDRVALELERRQDGLKRDIAMLDQLYDKNLGHLRALENHIDAGEAFVAESEATVLPALERKMEAAEGTAAQLAAQELSDTRQAVDRLSRKVHDLKLSRVVAMQTLPQIRLIQNGNSTLADKLQASIMTTIPTWKNQMTVALALHRQESALAMQKEIADTTNAMLKKNAEQLRSGATGIERETQRGIVDIDALAKVNEELIGTINDILAIQSQGRQERLQAEQEMKRIEGELKQSLTTSIEQTRAH